MKKQIIAISAVSLLLFSGCFTEEILEPVAQNSQPYTQEEAKNHNTVLVEEFSDIECPACKNFAPIFHKIEKDIPEIEFQYYHYPLEQIHNYAFQASIATECVGKISGDEAKEKYLYAAFAEKKLSFPFFKELAKTQGIDKEKFNTCYDNQETKNIVKAHTAEGDKRGLRGTPTLYINGEEYKGSRDYDTLYAFLQEKLAENK